MRGVHRVVAASSLLIAAVSFTAAVADEPKRGGILKIYHRDSPPSASIHEEATYSTVAPFMPLFNNLIMYKQDVAQNSLQSIVPDLASNWSWNEDKTILTFKLRQGVKWHDGKPFTANDVKCTFDLLMGKSKDSLRKNPRQDWYKNVAEVKVNGENEVALHLRRPQPALLALLASGYSPSVQVRGVQAERVDQDYAQLGLLEEGPSLSRRHRVHHHPQSVDCDSCLHCRQVRHDLPDRGDHSASQGRKIASAASRVFSQPDQRQHQPHCQPRQAPVRQCRSTPRHGARARPQGIRRHLVGRKR